MKNNILLLLCILFTGTGLYAQNGRETISLSGEAWRLWKDSKASWQNDKLYLPSEINDLSLLPVNEPTGGWESLTQQKDAIPVSVPGTVEEYLTVSDNPRPEDFAGVSWWYRTLEIPDNLKNKQFIIRFESVRLRAEVYLDGKLVAYDVIGESPFEANITQAVKPGKAQLLAVRVTNPGGNFHWQDFDRMNWGEYLIPPGRGFGGIIGRVQIEAVSPVYIHDFYIQNTPEITKIKANVDFRNLSSDTKQDIEFTIREKNNPGKIVYSTKIKQVSIPKGDSAVAWDLDVPEAEYWDLDTPNLYICEVALLNKNKTIDNTGRTFGFRWFAPEGIGKEAILKLNGRRIMLRSAISWGYWPVTGLIATPEMAERQIKIAQEFGLNMLNFHRCIGSPVVLEKADELGLLYYEEPGSFHSATHDPFIRAMVNEKLQRMIRRDRSHPSLVIYNLINEYGGHLAQDKELVSKRMNDMRIAHSLDISRPMTFTSGWAGSEFDEEDSKAHMLPYDMTLYRKGWYDNHRAGGPETWLESYYKSPSDNIMYTSNKTEVYFRGEEAALSTPARIQRIHDEISSTGEKGWDGYYWEKQYKTFREFFDKKKLSPYFGSLDKLTELMGNVSFEHQGRRIQSMRMQNLGDAYVVNGWEAMPYDNHSGIVDIYRNPKGNPEILAYYNKALYIAVAPRSQVVKIPGEAKVDFYIINEENLNGNHLLEIELISPDGKIISKNTQEVTIQGGDVFGQLLTENFPVNLNSGGGKYEVKARLMNNANHAMAEGSDDIWGVDFSGEQMKGKGASYAGTSDKFAAFYKELTGKEVPAFNPTMNKLDWIVVSRPSLDAPTVVEPSLFNDDFTVSYFKDDDMRVLASKRADNKLDMSFTEGAQPDASLPANQAFSAVWEGTILPPETGTYLIGIATNAGVRLDVDGRRMIDDWYNERPVANHRSVHFEKGKPVSIRVQYRQMRKSGNVRLEWSLPTKVAIDPQIVVDKVKNEGTTLIILESIETWIETIAMNTDINYRSYYSVGKDWVGGIHFVKDHPLFKELPVNDALNWPYQAVVREGDNRMGLLIDGEELIVGSYKSAPFEVGTAVGIIPCGKGKIIFSTLDIVNNLDDKSGPAEVARKIVCNYIDYHL